MFDEVLIRYLDNDANMIMSGLKCQDMNNKTNKWMKYVCTQNFGKQTCTKLTHLFMSQCQRVKCKVALVHIWMLDKALVSAIIDSTLV